MRESLLGEWVNEMGSDLHTVWPQVGRMLTIHIKKRNGQEVRQARQDEWSSQGCTPPKERQINDETGQELGRDLNKPHQEGIQENVASQSSRIQG